MSFRRAWGRFGSETTAASTALLSRTEALARERGEVGILAEALGIRAGQLVVAQRFDQASLTSSEGVELSRELRAENLELLPRAVLALVAAIRGTDGARQRAEEVLERGSGRGLPVPLATATWALGMVDLGQGHWAEAHERLDAIADERSVVSDGYVATLSAPDRVEAGVRADRPDDAGAALDLFETWARDAQVAAAQPRLASCHAQLADGDEATKHFEDAPAPRRRATIRPAPDPASVRRASASAAAPSRCPHKEIAAQMFLSKRTIDYHLRNVFVKLDVSSRTQLAGLSLTE